MKKILLILSMFQFVANAQIVNKFRDSTWFKSGVQFDGNVVFKSGAGSGKVWTSNSNGTGSWQTISSSGVSQGALNDSITNVRNIRKVDTIYKNLDSIIYKINGIRYALLDSTGGGTLTLIDDTLILGGISVYLPYIPLSGTVSGSPVTGDIEVYDGFSMKTRDYLDSGYFNLQTFGDGIKIGHQSDNSLTDGFISILNNGFYYGLIDMPNGSVGIRGNTDYTPYITALDYPQKKYVDETISDSINYVIGLIPSVSSYVTTSQLTDTSNTLRGLISAKQDNLISGTTIKTINSTSLLGSGNITTPDAQTLSTSYGSDSITLSISGGNSIKFAYAVDSVGMVSTDSLITYKAGVRRSYKVGSTGGGGALSAITAATATNTIDNTNYKQRWNWSTTAGDTAFALLGNSTGAASNLQNVLTVSNSGANTNVSQTTFGAKISNTKTGTSSINYGLYAKASGGSTANYAIGADGDVFVYTGFGYKFQSGGSITDGGALQITAGTNRAIFLTPTKAEGVDILTSANYISHNFYEVSGTDAGIIMGGRYNAGTYDPFFTTSIVQLQRQSGKLNFIAATGLAGSYTPSSYTIMTVNGTTSGAAGNVGIGTTSPSANAKLEITTTTLAPIKLTPMTATQASAVTAEDGQILYVNSTDGTFTSVGFWGRENGVWVKF